MSQAEYERTIHGWVGSRTAEDRDHPPGSKPEECAGCRFVEESAVFRRLQAKRCAVEEPVMKIRWQGEVVGFIENVRREVTSDRSHKLRGRWQPLTTAAASAFLKRLEESETRAEECGHLEIDCPEQYERAWFSTHPVTGEAWLTCHLKVDPRVGVEGRRRAHERLSELPRLAREFRHAPGTRAGDCRGCSEITELEQEIEGEA